MATNAFQALANKLPGMGTQAPTQMVQNFQNTTLAGLSTGTGNSVGPANELSTSQGPEPQGSAYKAVQERIVRSAPDRARQRDMLQKYAQIRGERIKTDRARAENARLAMASQSTAMRAQPKWKSTSSVGSQAAKAKRGGAPTGGIALQRVQAILPKYPGLRITETKGNRQYDLAHGVKRWAGSLHYDNVNPAVDIAGPPAQLDRMYRELMASGKWRQVLYRVPGHYDHIHIG